MLATTTPFYPCVNHTYINLQYTHARKRGWFPICVLLFQRTEEHWLILNDLAGNVQDSRQAPKHNAIGILNNSPLSLLLASLRSRDLNVEDCIGFKPRDRRVQSSTTKVTTTTR